MTISLLFPHQLFPDCVIIDLGHPIYLVEEYLFFKQYPFHKQKIALHRASMKCHAELLKDKGLEIHYIEATQKESDIRKLLPLLKAEGVETIHCIDPTDNYLERRLKEGTAAQGMSLELYDNPLFLNTREELADFFKPSKKKFFQTKWYKDERQRRDILIDGDGGPAGGKWTYDVDNRKKYPKGKTPPAIHYPEVTDHYTEAVEYVEAHFSDHYGELGDSPLYPTDRAGSKKWLSEFFEQRFHEFGPYEDAIVKSESILHHGVLTPMLNIGLLSPQEIIDEALAFSKQNEVPLPSLEGFIRQIIGWREFIRGIYEAKGSEERTRNYWGFERKIPASFYTGTTGIPPINITIKKLLKTGYNHHIERLMVMGNFMLLCEFDPDEVYRWFMEMYIDAYDWVMVTNVYGMSQFADGGLMSTKPYISGSNYLMKMSDYKKSDSSGGSADWQATWDGLFWRFMHVHRDFFLSNPRLGMLVRTFDKMPKEKQEGHIERAEEFLATLDD